MDLFVKTLDQVGKQIYNEKQKPQKFLGLRSISKEEAKTCWIYEAELDKSANVTTVLDHCHYIGKFLGWAHAQNLEFQSTICAQPCKLIYIM